MHKNILISIINKVANLKDDLDTIVSKIETSKRRVITLTKSYEELEALSLDQEELFKESLKCLENACYRAAHVLAWAAFIDFLHNKILETNSNIINKLYPKWNIKDAEDLRLQRDYSIIEAAEKIGLFNRTVTKALKGLLSRRNECSHPSSYFPEANETLGYINEIFKRIKIIQK